MPSSPRPLKYKLDPKRSTSNYPYRTICEVHRDIYRSLTARGAHAADIALVEEAYDLGKRMDAKLREYKDNYQQDVFEKQ